MFGTRIFSSTILNLDRRMYLKQRGRGELESPGELISSPWLRSVRHGPLSVEQKNLAQHDRFLSWVAIWILFDSDVQRPRPPVVPKLQATKTRIQRKKIIILDF